MCGESLVDSVIQQDKFIDIIRSYNKENDIIHLNIWSQLAENFQNKVEYPFILSGNKLDEESTLKVLYESNNLF
ncbi:MAG: hypothetical protein HC852_11935 [Acaryochloridaceae cyanobacterium RU_4_10]|nr:hypothetical protein [Acaryochloridaceae cyanobacterium RU_4_10]